MVENGCYIVTGLTICEDTYGANYRFRYRVDGGYACCPTTTPTPPLENGTPCAEDCRATYGPLYACDPSSGLCMPHSPVLVDVQGDGFALTDAAGGVDFAMTATGARIRVAWTAAGSDDAWLALDRNGDGRIGGAHELFGNFTPQPDPPAGEERQGFLALAVFDQPEQGGNSDGVIDRRDGVYDSLRLWRDTNHNGVSESAELHTLRALGLRTLELDYKESRRTDRHGNRFRYRAKVKDVRGAQLGRWAWDVFLVSGQ